MSHDNNNLIKELLTHHGMLSYHKKHLTSASELQS